MIWVNIIFGSFLAYALCFLVFISQYFGKFLPKD